MNLVERALRQRRAGRFLSCLALAIFIPRIALAADPIVSSNFAGQEDPLSENALWEPLNSMSPDGIRFQKNNGLAYQNGYNAAHNNHAGARMAAAAGVPNDHYAEIVVGHIGPPPAGTTVPRDYVGAWVRLQPSGPAIDSGYLYWGTNGASGENNWLYRIVANGSSYSAAKLIQHSPFADGDRVRLIARGPVIYGIHNGVREFIYNSGPDGDGCPAAPNCPPRYDTGTTGMLSFVQVPPVTDASISSWATGAAPASSGVWASTTFSGVEDPLDEGDRWYPLPGYQGFRKAGGLAIGRDINQHNISGVWSIAPPQKQYSEVTLGPVSPAGSGGGGGPVVRIDRTNLGQTGYLLFLYVDNPSASGVYKIVPGNFLLIGGFSTPPTLLAGDKWRLTADGNTLTVSNNGVFQFSVTDPNSTYPTGDVGMEAFKSAFTFMGWEGGDPAAAGTVQSPTISGFTPASGPVGTSVTISGTNFTG
ncbi:MAG TPA: hypothetical protein VEW47_05785, partial [Candidatus Dormibacteraeota bacterium]|nr:hypothetical protein [Candidatus Dormibacteraeota bacterium]